MQQPAADNTTECQLETEVALVFNYMNTNLLGPLSFGLVSASWFPSIPFPLFGSFSTQLQVSNLIKYL